MKNYAPYLSVIGLATPKEHRSKVLPQKFEQYCMGYGNTMTQKRIKV